MQDICDLLSSVLLYKGSATCYIKWKIPETNKSMNVKVGIILSIVMNFYTTSFCFSQNKHRLLSRISMTTQYTLYCPINYHINLCAIKMFVFE